MRVRAARPPVRRALLLAERDRMPALARRRPTSPTELGDPGGAGLAAAARRRAFWDPAHLEQRLAGLHRAADAGAARPATSSSRSRATPGSWSTCSSTAIATRSTPRSRRSRPVPSASASRCMCGTRPCGGRCARCSAGALDRGRPARRARRSRPARRPRPSPRRSTTRSSCWPSAASRGGWASSSGPARELVAANPRRPAWRAALVDAAVGDGPAGRGARGVRARSPPATSRTSPRTATG